jgi:hypothetical protein
MNRNPTDTNLQAGVPLTPADPVQDAVEGENRVATGDRREDVTLQPDPDQLVTAVHLARPAGPLPPQEQSEASERGGYPADPAVTDVRVAPDGPSVWDARPPPDDAERSGNPTGH